MTACVDRLISIFNALLRLAEIDAGVRCSGFVEIDVVKTLSDAVEFYQPVAELRGISLSLDLRSKNGAFAIADPLLMAQAIGTLIYNALKFARENGIVTSFTGYQRRLD